MSTYTKVALSGQSAGTSLILSSTGTTIHTAAAGSATAWDEIWLYAANATTSSAQLNLQWGSTSAPQQIICGVSGSSGLLLVAPGLILNNTLAITGYSLPTSAISIFGYVNRIT